MKLQLIVIHRLNWNDLSTWIRAVHSRHGLGVFADELIAPTLKCQSAVIKCTSSLISHLPTYFSELRPQICRILYKALVCPHLECCTQACPAYLVRVVDHVEQLKRLVIRLAREPKTSAIKKDLVNLSCSPRDSIMTFHTRHQKID